MAAQNFSNLIAGNPTFNASLQVGHVVGGIFSRAGFTNAKLYANPTSGLLAAFLIPEQAETSDPSPMVDTSTNLTDMGVPTDLPIYLQMKVDGFDDFITVGIVVDQLKKNPNRIDGLITVFNTFAPGLGANKLADYVAALQGAQDAVNADLAGLNL